METSGKSPTSTPPANEGALPDATSAPESRFDADVAPTEPRRARVARGARRARLYATAIIFVALLVIVVALAAANDRSVKLDWVAGSTHASLVWVIVVATIIGWLLGTVISALFRFRTRERH